MPAYPSVDINVDIAYRLIVDQFPEYAHLPIISVEQQGHDNRTYRLGSELLIRMPTAEAYALKVPKEQELLPKLAPYLTLAIPIPVKMGMPSKYYPYPFSIYKWLPGRSINALKLDEKVLEDLALDLAKFLKELERIPAMNGPLPGQHNWWRGDHLSIYDDGAQKQIAQLSKLIDSKGAMKLWQASCHTKWNRPPVWIHGDVAIGNLLLREDRLSAVIDFGGMALGDPACDLVMAWTYFQSVAREIFIREMGMDEDTWLRARGWALWKATFELCQIGDKSSYEADKQIRIIESVL